MAKNSNQYSWLKNFIGFFILSLLFACASIQSPSGGPKDVQPPKVVEEIPKNMTRNFKSKEIDIEFSEFIRLNNEVTEISISPALDQLPIYKVRKQFLNIAFQDTLEENTTYTINFGKAIGDVNENNLLTNYTYVFSTGPEIDSLSISGRVTDALTQEALTDVTVFILPVRQDSLFGKRRASIFTSTDSAGNFSLRNLREDIYRIYALREEGGGDRIYNSANDGIGFIAEPIKLTGDTANIHLEVFNEVPKNLIITDRKIESNGRITLDFNKPASAPGITILEPPSLDKTKVLEFSTNKDSALIWLPEMSFDSLRVALSDSGKYVDTVVLRRNKRDTYKRNILITDNTNNGVLKPGADYILTSNIPISAFDSQRFNLLQDSVPIKGPLKLSRLAESQREFLLSYPWRADRTYTLTIGDSAFTDIYGAKSTATSKTFSLDDLENYGNLTVQFKLPDTTTRVLVQLLNSQEEVIRTDSIPPSGKIEYRRFPTDRYQLRFVYDTNNNGKWDTGNLEEKRQPERIFNYEKGLTLRPNWDLEETITVPKDQ